MQPDAVHVQGHAPGQVVHGFLVGPLLQQLAQAQQEHDGAGGREVSAGHGDADGQGVQDLHMQLAPEETLHALDQVGNGAVQCIRRGEGRGQQSRAQGLGDDLEDQLLLVLPVQCPPGVGGGQFGDLGGRIGEAAEEGQKFLPVSLIPDNGAAGAIMDRDLLGSGPGTEIGFQQVSLVQGHPVLHHLHPDTPTGFMDDFEFHSENLQKGKTERALALSASSMYHRMHRASRGERGSGLRFFFSGLSGLLGGVLDDDVLLGGAFLVDVLGAGHDVSGALLHLVHALHQAVLHAQRSGGGVGIDILGILAGKQLQTGRAKQQAAGEQSCVSVLLKVDHDRYLLVNSVVFS